MHQTTPYLTRSSSGIFYFRVAVPVHLRTQLGLREIKRSLRTHEAREAKLRAAKITHLVLELFNDININKKYMDKNKKKEEYTMMQLILNRVERSTPTSTLKIEKVEQDPRYPQEEQALLDNFFKQFEETPHVKETHNTTTDDITLTALIDLYCAEKVREDSWTEKTEQENRAIYALLVRIIGDVPFQSVGYSEARTYKEALQKLPPNINKKSSFKNLEIAEILEQYSGRGMSVRSVNKYLTRVSSLMNWSMHQGYCQNNVFKGLTLKNNKQAHEERDVFRTEELSQLFSHPQFLKRDYRHPYYYWLPLLGLFTGARIEELCQLHLDDIHKNYGFWVFDINDLGGKRVKTAASKRCIPVHSKLLALGLENYLHFLRTNGHDRLFPELKHQRDGYSQAASKWFARFRKKAGVDMPGKNFHSFRHTVIDHLKQSGKEEPLIAALAGHAQQGVTMGRYGKPYNPQSLIDLVESIDFEQCLMSVQPFDQNSY